MLEQHVNQSNRIIWHLSQNVQNLASTLARGPLNLWEETLHTVHVHGGMSRCLPRTPADIKSMLTKAERKDPYNGTYSQDSIHHVHLPRQTLNASVAYTWMCLKSICNTSKCSLGILELIDMCMRLVDHCLHAQVMCQKMCWSKLGVALLWTSFLSTNTAHQRHLCSAVLTFSCGLA